MTSVFIVDDHYMVIEGIKSLLSHVNGIEWMGHATNAASCLAFLHKQQPDVILMDINLPDKSGIDLCKEVRDKYPGVFIIGLSTFNQQSFIQKMMENGASGYMLKNATQEELVEGIETVMKGKLYLSGEAAQSLQKNTETSIPMLTRREKEVLQLVAEGMTNNEIAEKLFISPNTVDTHRKSLLAKFGAKNTASLIRMAAQMRLI
ncbi:response regulator transcription factor [Flavitalea sp. BT771]|uniref:response regulator n=1 Tax=Flavitalea sp. BT771 TaxID=3063329 RepID=UPI0026E28796|nr:response regulator transcription factor [Flavitalea sp. BT771]MDO6429033.1 response regulator transcription factor [Flavitalea sp. BT771]MDV6218839.1 response regulator transcription factor [Flavitalea sp. BT771]